MANLQRQSHSDDDVQEIAPREMSTKRKRPTEAVKIESDEEVQDMDEDSSSDDDNLERMQGQTNLHGKRAKPTKGKNKARVNA